MTPKGDVSIGLNVHFEVTIDNGLYDDVSKLADSILSDLGNVVNLDAVLSNDPQALDEFLQRVEGLADASKRLLAAINSPDIRPIKQSLVRR